MEMTGNHGGKKYDCDRWTGAHWFTPFEGLYHSLYTAHKDDET